MALFSVAVQLADTSWMAGNRNDNDGLLTGQDKAVRKMFCEYSECPAVLLSSKQASISAVPKLTVDPSSERYFGCLYADLLRVLLAVMEAVQLCFLWRD